MLGKNHIVLIAERNPHIRYYLKREMEAAGYGVRLAGNAKEAVWWAHHPELLDLLILDPDLPGLDDAALYARLRDRIPKLPVVVHTYARGREPFAAVPNLAAVVEKRGRSIVTLKEVIAQILCTSNPRADGRTKGPATE